MAVRARRCWQTITDSVQVHAHVAEGIYKREETAILYSLVAYIFGHSEPRLDRRNPP